LESLIRLLVRFILVPLGYLAAVIAGSCVILFGSWRFAEVLMSNSNTDTFAAGLFGFVVAGPILFVMIFSVMWLPGAVGVLISEAFAIRSWIFHALNGAIAGWIGWQMFMSPDQPPTSMNEATIVFGAGLAGGFTYWMIAGWNAGFWKPVFRRAVLPPPAGNPFNPPATT